jgi:hypothetical protein
MISIHYWRQNDNADDLYQYFMKYPDTVYVTCASGKFDILLQTNRPLNVLPDRTLFSGVRGDYIYPETPFCSYESAINRMEALLNRDHEPSKIEVNYPEEPSMVGDSSLGWMIFPYVKYNLKTGFTSIVKKLHISFDSFYKGMEYLYSVSTVFLPYCPSGFRLYSQNFFVFWSNYEGLLCDSFSNLPCHTSITKVKDALLVYASVEKGLLEKRLLQFCFKLVHAGYVDRFWSSIPVYHWTRSGYESTGASPA